MKHHPARFSIALASALAALIFSGCNNTYEMEVEADRNPNIAEPVESYILVPRDPDMDTNDPRYKEVELWVKNALSGRGLYEAMTVETADIVVEIDYGMEPPRREYKVIEEPVYATVRGPDQIVYVQTRDAEGKIITVPRRIPGERRTELIGYEQRVVSYIVNEKYLDLTAKENIVAQTGDRPSQELWSVRVRNKDEKDDLDEYLPIMTSAAADYLGAETQEPQKVKLKENDEVVQFIKNTQPASASDV